MAKVERKVYQGKEGIAAAQAAADARVAKRTQRGKQLRTARDARVKKIG